MTERVTRWRPDTCGCVLDYSWDDTLSDEDIVLTCVEATLCEEHADLSGRPLGEIMEAVQLHNRSANAET